MSCTAKPFEDPTVYFVVPLYGRNQAKDWAMVCRNLATTLSSLIQQSDPNWQAFVCSQNLPEGFPDDPRIHYIPFEGEYARQAALKDGFDNALKKKCVFDHMDQHCRASGYLFQLDADDILHPSLVEYIRSDNNGTGYIIDRGYMCHAETYEMGFLQPWSLRHFRAKPFYKHCGSCAALRLDMSKGVEGNEHIGKRGAHKSLPETMRSFGLPLSPIPFHAALYMVGHGENMRERRGKIQMKFKYIRQNRVKDHLAINVAQEFGLPALR